MVRLAVKLARSAGREQISFKCAALGMARPAGSSVMSEIDQLIRQIATTDVTGLIEGESRTGKEIVARAVHERSRRRAGPFIAANFAALDDQLSESELFAPVRGPFNGAIRE